MNGKQAKLLRKCGLVEKRSKKQYNKLNKFDRSKLTFILRLQREQMRQQQ